MIGGAVFARLYDAVMIGADRIGLARRRESLAAHASGCVLEIGAGTGLEFPHYAPAVSVVAIEPDLTMIERARTRAAVSTARVALVAASEMRRVLRPSGVAHLLEHVRASHRPLAFIQEALTPLWRRLAGGCHLDRRTAEVLRRSGFDVTVKHPSFDGAVVELIARPSNTRRRDAAFVTASAHPQPVFSNAAHHTRRRRTNRR